MSADAGTMMAWENPYRPVKATIESVVEETPGIKTFLVTPEKPIPFATGQFVELAVPGLGEAPFTPSSSPAVADRLELTIMKAGAVTARLHEMKPGAELGLRGPLGKGYPLDEFAGKPLLILGGGVGLAPLRSLIYALLGEKEKFPHIIICYGARTPDDLVYRRMYDEWSGTQGLELHVSVDREAPGWDGNVGVVTTLLEKKGLRLDPAKMPAVVCGPPVMMKFATLKLLELGFPADGIYLSMEKNMSCGIGKCGHCRLGHYFVCRDGPVFKYSEIEKLPGIWD